MSGYGSLNEQTQDATDDYHNYVLGTCITNDDPEGLDRIKCTVPGLYVGEEAELPWIGPIKKSSFGVGPEFGVYGSPQPKSHVLIQLQNGDPHYPVYVGCILLPDGKNAKFHKMAWGFKDPVGNELCVDMESGTTTFTHQSNIKIEFANGTFNIEAPQDTNITAKGNIKIKASGNVDIQAGGNVNAKGTTVNLN